MPASSAARLLALALLLAALSRPVLAQADDGEAISPNLVPNGALEQDVDHDGWPDGWPRNASAAWVEEGGNHYLSLRPYIQLTFSIPLKPEWIAVRVRMRMRCTDIKLGAEGWQDARMVMSFEDGEHNHVDPWPDVLRGEGSFGWQQMERTFEIPPGAKFLNIGPANFAASGTADYDDITVQGMAKAPLRDLPLPAPEGQLWDLARASRLTSATQEQVCLNGVWQFRPALEAGELAAPPQGPGWGWFKVPGSWSNDRSIDVRPAAAWVMAKMNGVRAAWYRRRFTCPADWQGRSIRLRFDLVQTQADVYVDGRKAGQVLWPGGALDVGEFCRPGAEQTLDVLAVAAPIDARTQTFMGPDRAFSAPAALTYRGLCGDVYLCSSPSGAAIGDVFVQPSVRDKRLALDVGLRDVPASGQFRLKASVEHEGRTVKEFESDAFSAADLREGRITLAAPWADPPLWDVDSPRFCTLHLALTDQGGRVVDEALPQRFAFREFWLDGRDFVLNGKRIHLRAVVLNSADNADTGSVEGALSTFARMREYGFNFFIMGNYNFRPGEVNYFMDLVRAADRDGMLMSFSMPHIGDYRWQLDNPQVQARYRSVAAWCAGQVRNDPAVVLYAMNHNATGYQGDQNPELLDGVHGPDSSNRRQALIAQGIVASLDPTRPIYHHESGNLGDFTTLNCYLNWAPVRERSNWLSVWAQKSRNPLFFVEWGLPHISSWSSYRGPQFIWSSPALQQAWTHEFAAALMGEAAYGENDIDVQALKTELAHWQKNEPFGWWELSGVISRDSDKVLNVTARYAAKNWPAHRTWGASAMLPWDQDELWHHRDGAPTAAQPLDTDWSSLQGPGVSPDHAVRGDNYLHSRYPEKDWEPSVLGRAFLRVNQPLLAYLGGAPPDFTDEGHNFRAGETFRKQAVLINDTRQPVTFSYRWSLTGGPSGDGRAQVEPGGIALEPFEVKLPADTAPGAHALKLSVALPGGATEDDSLEIDVLPAARPPAAAPRIALYDPKGSTSRLLSGLGATFTEVAADADLSGYGLLVVGRDALTVAGPAPDIARVPDGLSVLVFEQRADVLQARLGFRTQVYGLRDVFTRLPDSPVLAGLSGAVLHDWRGASTLYPLYLQDPGDYNNYPHTDWCGFSNSRVWRCGNGGNVASALIEKPARGDFSPILDGGFDLQYAPVLEYRQGSGRVVFCQADVTGRTEDEPAAQDIVRNLLSYCAGPATADRRTVYYAGAPEGRQALADLGIQTADPGGRALGDGDLLVLGPGAPAAARAGLADALARGLNLLALANGADDLDAAPLPCRWERRTIVSSALKPDARTGAFAGLSDAETHFVDFVELPLLSQPAPADKEGLLASVRVGRGSVVFCQVAPWMFDPAKVPHDRTSYRRAGFLLARILANMGAPSQCPLLANWKQPAVLLPSLTEGWKGEADPQDVGLKQGWQEPSFDDSDWAAIKVPATFESQRPELADYDGLFWYRKTFDMPVLPADGSLDLVIGAVDDEDWTYLNGKLIGSITVQTNPDDHWTAERRYSVPAGLLKPTGNVLVVRMNDTHGSGGIVRGPVAFQAPGRWWSSYYIEAPQAGDDPYRYYRW
jgi:beta-galactosidase